MKTSNFQTSIIEKIYKMFPDSLESKMIRRKDLLAFGDRYGYSMSTLSFITDNKVGWGCYSLPEIITTNNSLTNIIITENNDVTQDSTVENVVPFNQPKITKENKLSIPSVESMIPEIDSNYVPFGSYKDIEKLIKSSIFAPVYITGHSGTGKNVMIEQICAKHKRPLIRINMHNQMTEEDLIGSKTLIDGNIEIVEGPLLIAMRTGSICILDELDSASAATFCLHSILEGKPYYFRLKNEMIYPKEGFNVIGLGNTLGKGDDSGRYMGTNILNEAFLERFALAFHQTYPTQAIEHKIVLRLMKTLDCENEEFANDLTKWSDAIRRTFEAGGIDEVISTRRITHIVKGYAIFGNARRAIELGCNRFDELTRIAFIELFDKISGTPDDESTNVEF